MTAFLYFFWGFLSLSPAFSNHESEVTRPEQALMERYPGANVVTILPQQNFTKICFESDNRRATAIFDESGRWQGTCREVSRREVPQGVLRESRHDLMTEPLRFFQLTSPHTYAPVYVSYALVKDHFPFSFPANGVVSLQLQVDNNEALHLVDRNGLLPAFRTTGVWMGGAYHASGRPLTHQTLQDFLDQHLIPSLKGQVAFPIPSEKRRSFFEAYTTCSSGR